jgi:hypothetical protein
MHFLSRSKYELLQSPRFSAADVVADTRTASGLY